LANSFWNEGLHLPMKPEYVVRVQYDTGMQIHDSFKILDTIQLRYINKIFFFPHFETFIKVIDILMMIYILI